MTELSASSEIIARTDPAEIGAIADAITKAVKDGGRAIFMGNGGSSADAQHIAAELSGRYMFDRPAMAGISLSNIAPVTAIGNDYSYDLVFKRQIEAVCRRGDAVVGISTSGRSKNVLLALEAAKKIGAVTISFTGEGGEMKNIVDHALVIRSKETPRIQEAYMVSAHIICGIVERNMYGRKAVFMDRDDTIVRDAVHCVDPDDIDVFPGVPEAIARLNDAGYLAIVITNQSVIGRGMIDEAGLDRIHDKMKADIAAGGGRIDDIFFCPHHPDAGCECRKPKIGMGIQAIDRYHIDTRGSYMIGDSDKDMQFGEAIGCRTVKVTPEYTFPEAVDDILNGRV